MKETPVTFKVAGEQIVGMLHLPKGATRARKCPAVVFLHGFTGNKQETHRMFVKTARVLAESGIAALRFDFRGSGDSGGDFSQMTPKAELEDARQAMAFIRARPEIDGTRLGVCGMSMGGMISALLLGEDHKIKSAVMWCPVGDPRRLLEARMTDERRVQMAQMGVADYGGWAVGRDFIEEMMHLRPLEQVPRIQAPLLIIHGDKDETVPLHESQLYYDALRAHGKKVERRLIAGADHGYSSLAWEAELIASTIAWFRCMLS